MTREEIRQYYNHGGIFELTQFQLDGYNVRIEFDCSMALFHCYVLTKGRYPKLVYHTKCVNLELIIGSLYHLEDSIKNYASMPKTLKTLLGEE